MTRRIGIRAVLAAALVAAVLAVASAAMARLDGGSGRSAAARAADDPVSLTVTFTRRPGARRVAHVRCTSTRASADGYLRAVGARRACARARAIARLLTRPADPHRACTEIYGGPERALVAGRIGARRVRHGFSRTDGCGVADWRRAMPLLPRPS